MLISSTRLLEIYISNILCKVVFLRGAALLKFQGSPVGVVEGLEASRANLLQRVNSKNGERKKP